MRTEIKLSLIALSTIFMTACGGSSGGGDNGKIKPPPPSKNVALLEEGAQAIKDGYSPLRLNLLNLREETVQLRIGLPKAGQEGVYERLISTTISQAHPKLSARTWQNGHDHSIQVLKTKLDTALDLILDNKTLIGENAPWEMKGKVIAKEDSGNLIVLPTETDIDDQLPLAFIENNASYDPINDDGQFTVINRFKHSTIAGEYASVCLATIDKEGSVQQYEQNLEITESGDLVSRPDIRRLVAVTHATLNEQNLIEPLTNEQLTKIQDVCPDYNVGNGETLQVLDRIAASTSGQYAYILYSPEEGELAFYNTPSGTMHLLPSLKWENE